MAKIPGWSAAFLLLTAVAITAPGMAAPTPKPEPAPHAGPAAKTDVTPRPRPEPPKASPGKTRTASQPAAVPKSKAPPQKAARKAPSARRAARRRKPVRGYAEIPLPPRSWKSRGQDMHYSYRERRTVREGFSSGPAFREDWCGEACAYRQWLERYRAWYDRYGSAYGAPPAGARASGPGPAYAAAPPRNISRRDRRESERARLDPWHGYNSRDGLGNGY